MGQRTNENEMIFLPLGGVGEIGMNVYLYGLGPPRCREWLMVDLGVTFADDREPGIDIVLPDLRFIQEERGSLAGILLTHAPPTKAPQRRPATPPPRGWARTSPPAPILANPRPLRQRSLLSAVVRASAVKACSGVTATPAAASEAAGRPRFFGA
jgi:hypothetical protein